MKKILVILAGLTCLSTVMFAQVSSAKFEDGIRITAKDSSFQLKVNLRIQSLMVNQWDAAEGALTNHKSNLLIRRARLKMAGWAYTPKLTYKMEIGLSNRDTGSDNAIEFNRAPHLLLDAYLAWNFYKNFTLQFGQAKLPGSRERLLSSANLQFVDRSRLNSRFTIDRDFGFQVKHHHKIGQMIIKETASIAQGEGRNVTSGHFDGYNYTFKLEVLPFGAFQANGEYVGAAIKKEATPKLALAVSYDINQNAVRERGQKGNFITNADGIYYGKNLNTFFVDMMFKYKNWSFLGEYAHKATIDNNPILYNNNDEYLGTFYTGEGLNLQAGYMLPKNWEIAARYTAINPDKGVAKNEVQYTLGLSRYIVGHKLKFQTDFTYRDILGADDNVFWRTQVEFQF